MPKSALWIFFDWTCLHQFYLWSYDAWTLQLHQAYLCQHDMGMGWDLCVILLLCLRYGCLILIDFFFSNFPSIYLQWKKKSESLRIFRDKNEKNKIKGIKKKGMFLQRYLTCFSFYYVVSKCPYPLLRSFLSKSPYSKFWKVKKNWLLDMYQHLTLAPRSKQHRFF